MKRAGQRWRTVLVASAVTGLLIGCVVDTPGIESTQPEPVATAAPAEVATPVFEPTVLAATPTALAEPTQAPVPTSTPQPTATPVPTGPPPLPTSAPEAEFATVTIEPGLVAVPVRGATFMLADARPILQLGGHTLIYLDEERNAEVDIFTPVATSDGRSIDSYQALVDYFTTDPVFSDLGELTPVSIAGFPTRVFEGTANSPDRAFITDPEGIDDELLGWFPPVRMRLWVIDHPAGPVIVSAESLENPGRYSDAVRLATEVLSTIDFG